jgi:N-acetylglutamate synthase-like GNAT family acetyltransferase
MNQKEVILVKEYSSNDAVRLTDFLEKCLPESGRRFEPNGAHAGLLQVEQNFDYFICLIEQENEQMIGTCALKRMDERKCELKYVYLYQQYHGQGWGCKMSQMVIDRAKKMGYKEMYLDTISRTSGRAIKMYERLGFKRIEKYHETARSDVFMKLCLE